MPQDSATPEKLSNSSARHFLPLLLLLPAVAMAQPDAGTLRQQIEQDQAPRLPREAIPERPAEPPPVVAPTGITVTVTAFRFAGNTLLTEAELAPAVAPFLNRPLGLAELRKAAAAVAETYREAGWVVRAYLPKQDVREGTVTIQIVEAVFGGAVIEGDAPRMPVDRVQAMVERAQARGEKLNSDAIERATLLIDDLPGVAIKSSLRAGKSEPETELALTLADEPLARFEVGADNTGSYSTGAERLQANLSLSSPFKLGDLLSANYVHTRGSDYLRAAYTVPVGHDGWRVGLNASQLDYKIVKGDFAGLMTGDTGSVGLEASYPLIRSRLSNLYLQLNHDRKSFDNEFNGATTRRYRMATTSIGLAGNLFDKIGGGGANSASLVWVSGRQMNDIGAQDDRFSKLRYSLRRQQLVTEQVALFAALSGQWTNDNLDSSERFYLGGAHGVRAYPSSEAGGAIGQMLNLEARIRLPKGFTLIPFYDWGRVEVNADNAIAAPANPNTLSLKGAGVALGWQHENGLTARLTWARRIGDNPNPTATGKDQDGTRVKNRLWASVMLPF